MERGYVDGAIWILGDEASRPKAMVTTELHPNFYDQGPKIIYEFLSLTEAPFKAESPDFSAWIPSESEASFDKYPQAGKPAETDELRLQQMKAMAVRCRAWQTEGANERKLRLVPEPILRYRDPQQSLSRSATEHRRRCFCLYVLHNARLDFDLGIGWRHVAIRHRPPLARDKAGCVD